MIRIPSIDNRNIDNKFVFDIGFGEFDHHQKNRNGKRENGIFYSSNRKAIKLLKNRNVKYLIFKSKRECYDIRITDDIMKAKILSKIYDLIYIDTHGKLCCTKTLDSAIKKGDKEYLIYKG